MCYHVKFYGSASEGVRLNRKKPKLGIAVALPRAVGAGLTSGNTQLPRIILPNLVVLSQTVRA